LKAILLAAGRGERMRPLTDTTPKPLLEAGGRSLIAWQLRRLAAAGISEVAVNVCHLGEQIVAAIGDGSSVGVRVRYSREATALETAGGIALAGPLLGEDCFIVTNADIYCEFDYSRLVDAARRMSAAGAAAHLVLVPNPEHHPAGDFTLDASGRLRAGDGERLTYSGIGLYRADFFAAVVPGERRALGPLLHGAVARGEVTGERYDGLWMDIGTPERLERLRALIRADA
jgi:MurNAc alpha-1-phosphate uridylyltransferase